MGWVGHGWVALEPVGGYGVPLSLGTSPKLTRRAARTQGTAIQAAILTDRKRISVGATEATLHAHLEGDVER